MTADGFVGPQAGRGGLIMQDQGDYGGVVKCIRVVRVGGGPIWLLEC